mgnify:CR=1 FL=1
MKSKTGWWSGALSSRDSDTEKYYPLFCRIEIKAKVPYLYGLWNALWLRHYKGAGVAEIDILEFFTKAFGENPYPAKANQTLHLFNSENAKVGNQSTQRQIRYTEIGEDKPGDNFHVYAVQIDPDPVDNNHAIITFLIDNKSITRYIPVHSWGMHILILSLRLVKRIGWTEFGILLSPGR